MAASKGMEFARARERNAKEPREKKKEGKQERKREREEVNERVYCRDIILYVVKRCRELSSVERLLLLS